MSTRRSLIKPKHRRALTFVLILGMIANSSLSQVILRDSTITWQHHGEPLRPVRRHRLRPPGRTLRPPGNRGRRGAAGGRGACALDTSALQGAPRGGQPAPPRGAVEVGMWQGRRRWLGDGPFLEGVACEHYLLHVAPRVTGCQTPPMESPRRAA